MKEIRLEKGLQLWVKAIVVSGWVRVCEGAQEYHFRQEEKAIEVIYQTCNMRQTSMRPSKPGSGKRNGGWVSRIFSRGFDSGYTTTPF